MSRIIARAWNALQQRSRRVHQSGIIAKNCFNVSPYPATIFSRLLIVGFLLPSSMSPRYVLFIPTTRPNSRSDQPRSSRRSFSSCPICAFVFVMPTKLCEHVH